jgi:hypothetical protein
MLVILVFVVQVKAEREIDPARGKPLPSFHESGANGPAAPDKPVVVMQHEDIERLLESTT